MAEGALYQPALWPDGYRLNNGYIMPSIGCSTYHIRHSEELFNVVDVALGAGYRLFDTAAIFGNEASLGNALRALLPKYGLVRDDVFVISKLSPSDLGDTKTVRRAYYKCINNLDLEDLDLFLIHFPGSAHLNSRDLENRELRDKTWAAMIQLYEEGAVRSIGVSNFTVKHLQHLLNKHDVVPTVNQVEWHPYYHQMELYNYCRSKGIVLQAYGSLGGSTKTNYGLYDDPVVVDVNDRHRATSAEVLLAWVLQKGLSVIPRSSDPLHIKQNINIKVRLSPIDMLKLDRLGVRNTKYGWDPQSVA